MGETLDDNVCQSRVKQLRPLAGPVAILWDIENCNVPGYVRAEDVAGNIRMALRVHPAVKGTVTAFSAYGDFNRFPRKLREGCQRTGVNLIDVPNGKKNASDKAIMVDMFLFAIDNSPPCTIFLISGDVDFAAALHKLGQRGYTVVIAIPAGVGVPSALCSAGRFVWDWPSLARGEGLVPVKGFLAHAANSFTDDKFTDMNGYAGGRPWFLSDDSDTPYEDELHVCWRSTESNLNHRFPCHWVPAVSLGSSRSTFLCNLSCISASQDSSQVSGAPNPHPSFSGQSMMNLLSGIDVRTSALPGSPPVLPYSGEFTIQADSLISSSSTSTSASCQAQPRDIQELKGQLLKLLKMNGGKLILVQIPSEYYKLYGRPLYLIESGSSKIVQLIEGMTDAFFIRGEGHKKTLHLKEEMCATSKGRRERGGNFQKNGRVSSKVGRLKYHQNDGQVRQVILLQDRNKGDVLVEEGDDHDTLSTWDLDGRVTDQGKDNGGVDLQQPDMVPCEEHGNLQDYEAEVHLDAFRQELQELLVSHACRILLASFLTLYQQKYSRDLDFSAFGVEELESLIEKVKDVVVLKEEQGTRRKFLLAKCNTLEMDFI